MAAQQDRTVVEIDGTVGLSTIAALHRRLVDAMKSAATVTLELGKADGFDLTFIQLVESARRYAAANGKTIALAQHASGELGEQLARGGFLVSAEDRAFWGATP